MISFLKTIRILDEDGTVSFSSVYLYAALALVSLNANEWTLGTLALVLTHANLKRYSRHKAQVESNKKTAKEDAEKARLDKLESEVANLRSAQQMSKLNR